MLPTITSPLRRNGLTMVTGKGAIIYSLRFLSRTYLPSGKASSLLLLTPYSILPPRRWHGASSFFGNIFCQLLSCKEGCPSPWGWRDEYPLQIQPPHLCQGWDRNRMVQSDLRSKLFIQSNFTGDKSDVILEYLFVGLNKEKLMVWLYCWSHFKIQSYHICEIIDSWGLHFFSVFYKFSTIKCITFMPRSRQILNIERSLQEFGSC